VFHVVVELVVFELMVVELVVVELVVVELVVVVEMVVFESQFYNPDVANNIADFGQIFYWLIVDIVYHLV